MSTKGQFVLGVIYRLALIIIFVGLGFWIVMTAAGYRVNLSAKGRKVIPTALIVVKPDPADAKVYLNGQPTSTGRTGNLSAGWYELKAEKEGYFGWQKNIHLNEAEVAVVEPILFLRESKDSEKLSEAPGDSFFQKITNLVEKPNLEIKNSTEVYIDSRFATRFSYPISAIKWYLDDQHIAYLAPDGLYVADSDGANAVKIIAKNNLRSYSFIDGGRIVVFEEENGELWSAEIR